MVDEGTQGFGPLKVRDGATLFVQGSKRLPQGPVGGGGLPLKNPGGVFNGFVFFAVVPNQDFTPESVGVIGGGSMLLPIKPGVLLRE